MNSMFLGEITLDWLAGTDFGLDGGAMFGVVPKVVWNKRYPCDAENFIPLATRSLLVRRTGLVMLVDAGYGNKLNDKQIKQFRMARIPDLARDLRAWGLEAEDITHLVFTHMHPDHAGGATHLTDNGEIVPAFPRARVIIQEREYQAMAEPNLRNEHAYWAENWRSLEAAGLIDRVSGDTEIAPGIELILTGGHTSGHQAIRFSGGGQTVLHLGDLLPTHAHLNPLWVMAYDDFPMESIAQKAKWLGLAQARGWWLSFYHDIGFRAAKFDLTGQLLDAYSQFT